MSLRYFLLLLFTKAVLSACSQTSAIIPSNGSKLYYRVFGKGDPILVINGGPGMNSEGFTGLATELAKHNQVILYDQRGTGHSLLPSIDSSTIKLDLMVKDMEVLRQHLGIGQWIILGHSFGGMLAAYYASIHPAQVRALIFSHSGGIDLDLLSYAGNAIVSHLNEKDRKDFDYWTDRISKGDTSYAARIARGKALAPAYVYEKKNLPAIAERLTQGNNRINGLIWDDMNRIKFDCAAGLSSFKRPVLIIQGKQDIVSEKTAEKAKAVLPQAELILMDHCIHYGWLDRPDLYYPALRNFIDKL